MRRSSTNPRSGYALLMIFCMAAMVSIMLYSQMPRVAFEAQRDKEQLLIDRGEEYSRAVSLYVRKLKKFPATMEALENTNNIRFLRKRYKDPLTGKEEWRLIHVGPNGVFTDSKVYGKKDKDTKEKQTFITELPMSGTPAGDAAINLAMRKRQSDGPNAPGTGEAINGGAVGSGMQVNPDGSIVPQTNGQPQPLPPGQISGLPPGVQLPAGIGSQQQPGLLPGQPGAPATSPTAGTAYSTALGANGQTPTPFGQQPGTSGAASDMIRNLLTSPRPGGQFGTPAAASGTPAQTTIGGGIAGVASNLEREGIKIYKEKTAYNEWEFVYDMSKDPTMANNGAGQTAAPRTGQPGVPGVPGQQPTTPIPAPRPPGQ